MNVLRRMLGAVRFRQDAESIDLLGGPIQGELLGVEHLAERARALAREQVVLPPDPLRYRARLLERLDSTRHILDRAYVRIARDSGAGRETDPSGEWLLDNYHVLQEHIQDVRASLPRGYYRELPELADGILAGYPRVYEVAIALISHSEGRIDLDNVDLFVDAFQEIEPLLIGELWAVPAMLRLALIESIRRMALRTVRRLDELAEADRWADRVQEDTGGGRQGTAGALRDLLRDPARLTPTFISRVLAQLRSSTGASPSLLFMERWLHAEGLPPEDAAAQATQRVAHTQLTMANSITSLRAIGRRDWRGFVEKQSLIEAILLRDPAGAYGSMTFATRDRYRHVVERIARRSSRSEQEVAELAIGLARAAENDPTMEQRRHHVGCYLIAEGLPELEAVAGASVPLGERLTRAIRNHPDLVLVGGLTVLTLMALGAANLLAGISVVRIAWPVILIFTFFPAWDIGISVVNQLVTAILPPRVLPSLDLRDDGVPEEMRTVVVVPTLFASEDDVADALDHLEVCHLANRGGAIQFAILSDFTDAQAEVMPGDAAILAAAAAGIRALNDRHATDGRDFFHLLHRPRRWNPGQGKWMGWERKRGKLSDFNRLLRSGSGDAFLFVSGGAASLRGARYVITLDADTVLPQGTAAELIGTIAHPLHRAVYDAERGRVVAGYGILQPRVGVSLLSAHRSRFARILAGQPGVDPYTTAVSDVYQDLYAEGSFTGKGIYDVDAFMLATRGRFPENTLLSHDLIEGSYVRAALATGIIVYDDIPAGYVAHARRKHRWIRGDWQLLPWLGPNVPGPDGPEPNRLSLLSRWKILDNMRRSTVEVAQLALIIAGWSVLAGSPIRWTLLALGAISSPWLISLLLAAVRPPADRSWRAYYGAVLRDAMNGAEQFGLAVAFLPHQVWLSLDAIGRTLVRLFITRRHLLEWTPAAETERRVSGTVGEHWRVMGPAVLAMVLVSALVTGGVALRVASGNQAARDLWLLLGAVVPLTLLWISSPWLATRLGARSRAAEPLDGDLTAAARRYAGDHWRWFDHHVTAETHWLAPDNVQFDPVEVTAMRTSPTNIGLQLLATMSAHDLGILTSAELAERLARSFDTIERLRTFRGHLHNWYALDDLRVLEPAYVSTVDSGNLAGHLLALRQGCLDLAENSSAGAEDLAERFRDIADRADRLVRRMDFRFLFDESNRLLSIGFHPDTHTLDAGCYDLLASEARLASFVAIAKGDLPPAAWFRMGRRLIRAEGVPMMVSWSGSMFEYLMPLLVMRSFPGTLLDQSDRGAVRAQIAYGDRHVVPWGVSESAYNLRDKHLTYQYRAFGIPELALKRGLARELVVAPYASALAAMLEPAAAIRNLMTLEQWGALGHYGFWDALDFTRPVPGARVAMVRTVMAHHAGMTIVALANVLKNNVWQRRFHSDAMVRANELLLQERVPRRILVQEAPGVPEEEQQRTMPSDPPVTRRITSLDAPEPRVALLGDLPYTVMVTDAGSGVSRYDRLAVTRWRPDGTTDSAGQFCYVRDVTKGLTWSAGYQPTGVQADSYLVEFAADRATIERMDRHIETRTEIVVVPADAAELRRVTLTNHDREPHEIELTSYAEVVMGPADADAVHPAFANLFVETEWHEWCSAITARRRPRQQGESAPWCVHLVDAGPNRVGPVSCETDRSRFIGRGRTTRQPAALDREGPLSGTTGAVLDPIVAIRTRVRVRPGESVSVSFTTLVAPTREQAFDLADRYHDPHAAQRAHDLAWMATQIELRETGLDGARLAAIQDLAGRLLYGRASVEVSGSNRGGQARLWNQGISGDLPILLATIKGAEGLATLEELFVAHRHLRRRGLDFDLVVVVAEPHDYLQQLRDAIIDRMVAASDAALVDQPGGVFIRRRDGFEPGDYLMLAATAAIQIDCDGRPLTRIISAAVPRPGEEPPPVVASSRGQRGQSLSQQERSDPTSNGFGGLDGEGNYLIRVSGNHVPPAPWVNVISNPLGGFIVSERGAGCTWAGSSYFYRITPWHNDPVTDPVCDALYISDRDTGDLWSATPAPVEDAGVYGVCHAPGRSTFAHHHDGIATDLTVGVPVDAAVKLSLLRLTNRSDRPRTLTLTAYAEWTLGVRREVTTPHVRTWFEPELGAVLAQNRFDAGFADKVAFISMTEKATSHTGDRRGFIGRHGDLSDPAALRSDRLDNVAGSGLDPCGAIQCTIVLEPGESREVAVLLGAADGEAEVAGLISRLGSTVAVRGAVDVAVQGWQDRLSTIAVHTPDPDFDVMINRWTLYQALSSRMWTRAGLYQSSGAYGFRDQLQDVMAFVHAEPGIAREHLLRAASRQFVEGDVQHWWHPLSGRGVRTRFSDDLAWLPFVVDHYVRTSGDTAVLDEVVPFIAMRELLPHEHELYDQPHQSGESATLYEHCLRALRRACTSGVHGLPLIGSGDWNDGFSRVGVDGRGESVWLAWFLIACCSRFAVQAERRGDDRSAAELRSLADGYAEAVELHGWDGSWYRRAWFDDGTPLGTAAATECRIDSIAQSWSVISGAGSRERQETAMESLHEHLVDSEHRLIALLAPPFDDGDLEPGYIKGYLPGVRENGAQYTHAALWAVQAMAMMGDSERAWEMYRMINPLSHSKTSEDVATYQVEPYVIAADVYTAKGQAGRGGWTWYTGSASWMYRIGLESLLGFTREGDRLTIRPCVPESWPSYRIEYRHGGSRYAITVRSPAAVRRMGGRVTIDGVAQDEAVIPLLDDGRSHEVVIAPLAPED